MEELRHVENFPSTFRNALVAVAELNASPPADCNRMVSV